VISAWPPPAPCVPVPPERALGILEAEDIVVRLDVLRDFDTSETLSGRMRGALGQALMAMQPQESQLLERRAALWRTPTAYDALFCDPIVAPPRVGSVAAAPARPYVLFTQSSGRRVTITLRVFGRARQFLPTLQQALTRALCDQGISVMPLARARARFPDMEMECGQPPQPAPLPEAAALRLVATSPWMLDRKGRMALDAAMLGNSVISRAAAVLAWCGCWLEVDPEAVNLEVRSLELCDQTLSFLTTERRSQRQGRTMEFRAVSGGVTLRRCGPILRTLLPLIEVVGLGSATTSGFGRVAVFHESPWNRMSGN